MLTSSCPAGICNRLRCLITTMRLSDEPAIYWPQNKWIKCSFGDLFTPTIKVVNTKPKTNNNGSWRMICLPTDNLEGQTKEEVENRLNAPSIGSQNKYQDTENYLNELPDDVKNGYFNQLDKLKLRDDLADTVEKFASNFDENTVSVSFRSWHDAPDRKKYFVIADFEKMMESFDKDVRFFITSDSDKVVNRIKKRFGDRIIFRKKLMKCGDNQSIAGMKGIIIDLYLLSKNSIHLGTRYSTYSEFAWWLSRGKQKFSIVKDTQ